MNKKTLFFLAAIAMSATAMPALAQDQDVGQGQELSPQKFEALKLVLLSRLKQKEACVQAAADPQALRECMMPGGGAVGGSAGGGEGSLMHGGRPMMKGGSVNPGGPMMGAGGGGDDGAPPVGNQ